MMVRMMGEMTRTPKAAGATLVVAPRRELCLDFANTVAWRGSQAAESLHGFADLLGWCKSNGVLGSQALDRATRWSLKRPDEAATIFQDAIALREIFYRLFFGIAAGKVPDARAVAEVNRALELAPARRVLAHA